MTASRTMALAATAGAVLALAGCKRSGVGEPCDNNGECRPPLYCDPGAGTCAEPTDAAGATDAAATDATSLDSSALGDAGDSGDSGDAAGDAGDAASSLDSGPGADAATAALTVPLLRRPMNAAYTGDPNVPASLRFPFEWWPATGGTAPPTYDLQYSTDPTFAAVPPLPPPTSMTSTLPLLALTAGRWWWRVRACDATACSAYSPAWYVDAGRSDRDVDGDGCADVVAGASLADGGATNGGEAYVYRGELFPTPFDPGVDFTFSGGDVDGGLGHAVSTADVNGDGYADVIAGAPHVAATASAGQVFIYFGAPLSAFDTGPDVTLSGEAPGDQFGASVALAGDVDGDGFADVVIGAPAHDGVAGTDAGRVYVFRGATGTTMDAIADSILDGTGAGDLFGAAVAGLGDVNGDGLGDIAVGAPASDAGGAGAGGVTVFLAGAGGAFGAISATLLGLAAGDAFGTSVAPAGDVDADAYADLIVGAPSADGVTAGAGAATVFLGGAGATFDTAADATLLGEAAGDAFGTAVAGGGDTDWDGVPDLLVGAPMADPDGSVPGVVYVFRGGAVPLETAADVVLVGPLAAGIFGASLANAGDVQGDGIDDVLAGAPASSRIEVYLGSMGGLDPIVHAVLTGASGTAFASAVH